MLEIRDIYHYHKGSLITINAVDNTYLV